MLSQKISWPLLLLAAVAGCATHPDTSELRSRSKTALETTRSTLVSAQSALECAGGGATAAVLLCRDSGGSPSFCAQAAVEAGVAGATICYSYATRIQQHRKELAGHENDLDARIQYLRGVNDSTEDLTKQLTSEVGAVTANTDRAVESLAQGKLTQEQLDLQRQALDNEVKAAQAQAATASQELEVARQFRAQQGPSHSGALDAEITRLEGLLDQVQRNTSALAAQRQRI